MSKITLARIENCQRQIWKIRRQIWKCRKVRNYVPQGCPVWERVWRFERNLLDAREQYVAQIDHLTEV